jgi:tetraacyldisaccharide 4'-kinase
MEMFRFLLFPLIIFYAAAIWLRNKLFDMGLLKSHSFALPIISVGNLAVGGSGKTPLVEYLVRLLSGKAKVAILSRGYKRLTSGYHLADAKDTAETIGDEPMQYHKKFTGVVVAVCEKRKEGIRRLISDVPDIQIIILDDAYQHRYVKPTISILASDYFTPFTTDWLLPFGRLREPVSARKRADIIVVTKTPRIFSPIVRKQFVSDIKPFDHQKVCFSYINYLEIKPLYEGVSVEKMLPRDVYSIIAVSGIVNPGPFQEHLKKLCNEIEILEFPDHHVFSESDVQSIADLYNKLPTKRKIIVVTEKDASRLKNPVAESILKEYPIYFLPIEFDFHQPDKQVFDAAMLAVAETGSH